MASPVPKPVSACLGLVPTVLDGVRRLPLKAVQLPVLAVSSALGGIEFAKREYGELSARGERLVAQLRGTSLDDVEDRVESRLQGTPVASLYDRVEDTLEDVGATVTTAATRVTRDLTDAVRGDAGRAVEKAAEGVRETAQQAKDIAEATQAVEAVQEMAAVQETLPEAEQPKGEPTPKSEQPDSTRIDTAATAEVVEAVEQVAGNAQAPAAEDLPLPDYDHMTLGSLRGRLRSLSVEQLVSLRAYEKSKADRLPVITMLDNRIAKLAAGEGEPTGAVPTEPSAKASTPKKAPKKVGQPAEANRDSGPPHTKVRTT